MPSTYASSVVPLSSCLQSFQASGSFLIGQFFPADGQNKGASALASVLPMDIRDQFPLGWTCWIVQGTSRSSTTPQFKRINSLALSVIFGPTLTSMHDYWKNHSFDKTEVCQHCNISAFSYAFLVCHRFSSKKQASLISWLQS